MTGGCLCGAVRFRLASAPADAGWCHCRTCQLNSGSPAMAFAAVPVDDYLIDQGAETIGSVQSSETGRRHFCRACGTPLWAETDADGGLRWFSLATLDQPGVVEPKFHIFYASRIPWAEACDDLPRHDRILPDAETD